LKFIAIQARDCSNRHIVNVSHAGVPFQMEVALPVRYKEALLDCGHQAQILTYMCLEKAPVGLLINFNVRRLQNGTKRFVL